MNRLEILPVNLTFDLSKSTSLRHLTICFLSQIFVLLLPAQEHYNFIHYPAESGIVSFQVNTAVQDQQGYMWFGTTSGLQRFDGIRFKTFRHDEKNPGSLPSNPVWQSLVDKKNNLWLMLSDGRVGIFDTRNFIFNGKIGLIGFFDDGRVWVSGEDSNKWHLGYGGGLMLAPFNKLSITAYYGVSEEGGLLHIRFGTLF